MATDPYTLLAELKLALEQIPGEMLLLKKRGSSKQELRELATQASVLLLELRQVIRKSSLGDVFRVDYCEVVHASGLLNLFIRGMASR